MAVSREADFDSILRAAQAGEEWALAHLYRDVHPRLLRYLRARSAAEPEDLAADVWLEAATGLARFRGDDVAFRRWLFTIARRRLLDRQRRDARRRTDVATDLLAAVVAPDDPEAEAIAAIATESALRHVAALPPHQADVVLLRIVAGLPVEDVAEILGKRPGTVRVLQHRALARLAKQLSRLRVTR